MRLRFTGILAAGLFLSACGGSDSTGPDDGSYYLRFKANGTQISYTDQVRLSASVGQASNQHTLVALGFDNTTNFSIIFFDGAPVSQKTYSGYDINQNLGVFIGVLFAYEDQAGVVYGPGDTNDESATITELTASSVRGTFNGTVRVAGQADVLITNGEFYLPRGN